jgi:hypothetical protein
LLKDRSFAGAQFAIMGFGVAMFGSIAILPLFVQGLLGYPVLDAGLPVHAARAGGWLFDGGDRLCADAIRRPPRCWWSSD